MPRKADHVRAIRRASLQCLLSCLMLCLAPRLKFGRGGTAGSSWKVGTCWVPAARSANSSSRNAKLAKQMLLHYRKSQELLTEDMEDSALPPIGTAAEPSVEDGEGGGSGCARRGSKDFVWAAFWVLADALNFLAIGIANTTAAVAIHGVQAGAVPSKFVWRAASTTFLNLLLGGTTLSSLLLVLTRRFGSMERSQVVWLGVWPYVCACIGIAVVIALQSTAHLDVLNGSTWRLLMQMNSAALLVSALLHSGWFPRSRKSEVDAWSIAGTFLYACGGSMWRDFLLMKVPSAFSPQNMLPLITGLFFCRGIRCIDRGNDLWILLAASCVYVTFARPEFAHVDVFSSLLSAMTSKDR